MKLTLTNAAEQRALCGVTQQAGYANEQHLYLVNLISDQSELGTR